MAQELVEVVLTDMAYGGKAVGRYQGLAVFVPYSLPGERVRVRITETRKRYAHAELVEVVEPSAGRVEPLCKHFGECGGCQWQHIAYSAQLAYKRQILAGQMAWLAGLPGASIASAVGMEIPWNYRNHVQFALDEEGRLAFQAARSHRLVAIEECYLLHPLLEDILASLELDFSGLKRLSLRAGVVTEDALMVLEIAGDELPELEADVPISCVAVMEDGSFLALVGRDYIEEEVAGRRYRISAGSFFQVNTAQAEHLVRLVGEALAPQGGETLWDLYCGVGILGLSLADRVQAVVGVEESASAVADARLNARDRANVAIIEGQVERVLTERRQDMGQRVDLAIVDPPRAGMDAAALVALAAAGPQRIAYVSCDPASLARDVKRLSATYALRQVWPVDMFPQTYHIESVALLERL